MDYIIVPTSNSDYQSWQCRLLNWSRKKVKQPGKLIFLRCADEMGKNRSVDVYTDTDVEVIDLPDYALEWERREEQAARGQKYWWAGAPNKYRSIKWLCENYPLQDTDSLLFLDPDMIFVEPITDIPEQNEIIAQQWIKYQALENWKAIPEDDQTKGIMCPFIIRAGSIKKILHDYVDASENIRREIQRWESDMWGLDYAVKKNKLNIRYVKDFGFCTAWKENGNKELSRIIHFPNKILNTENDVIFFKQEYTTKQDMKIQPHMARNNIEQLLLLNITQERTDYLYHLKWNFKNLLKNYTGDNGYVILKPWPGGFNNIRMSLELAVCISYLTNKTLVLPPKYKMYLLQDEFGLEDFFDVSDLGIKHISLEQFCQIKNIPATFESVAEISKVIAEPDNHVLNFTGMTPPVSFTKGRPITNMIDLMGDAECLFFNKKLLGNFYQTIYTEFDAELKQLIAKHVHYTHEILDLGWKAVQWIGDGDYYAIHVRRNDFQYKHLFISIEEIYNNIKDIIPKNAKLYIATDHKDLSFFDPLKEHYQLFFYTDVATGAELTPHYNFIPIIEQLICTRALKFVGNDYSTLSSYVYRLRGYMNDVEDTNFYINTSEYNPKEQCDFIDTTRFVSNWAREFKDAWDFKNKKIFVSIASYRDQQLIPTLQNLYNTVFDLSRITVGVHLQDDADYYQSLLSAGFPNLKIIFTPKEESQGVVWARQRIKNELITDEEFFLQVDAHSRFKKNWDAILINQYRSMPHSKVVISTYPNNFELNDDNEKKYLNLKTNAPLIIKNFFSENTDDNRLATRNLAAMNQYEVVDNRWIGAGFIFAPTQWVREINVPSNIKSKGEEEIQLFLSYLSGWDIKLPAEATVWHNYNIKALDGSIYRHPNFNSTEDKSIENINNVLFKNTYTRTTEQLEDYLNIKFNRDGNRKLATDLEFNLGFYGSHNSSVAISKGNVVLEVLEVERLVSRKNEGFWWYYHIPRPYNMYTLDEVKKYFERKYGVTEYNTVAYNSTDSDKYKVFPAKNYVWVPHHMAHAYSGLYQSPHNNALIVSFDGGSDEGFFNVFLADKRTGLTKLYSGKRDLAVPYAVIGHHIQDIKREEIFWGNLVYAGKLMGFANYGTIRQDFVDKLIAIYNAGDAGNVLKTEETVTTTLGISKDFRFSGQEAKDLAASNQFVFEKIFEEEISSFLNEHPNLPVILVGGCALNILNNTKLTQTRTVFVPPNPNDCGLGVGLLASIIKPEVPIDCTYIGPEVWDRYNLSRILIEKNAVPLDIDKLADDIVLGKIVGVVRGRSEHGPRALGNRSIICNPSILNMKDILNAKVKGREYYRPFAPVVRLEDVNKYFEWEGESRWMSYCPNVREEWKGRLQAITHVDGTARVQTVTKEQNEFLYKLLSALEVRCGIGVLLNTSFNIAGKPILNTYHDAIWMLENTQMDGLILEDFYIVKK